MGPTKKKREEHCHETDCEQSKLLSSPSSSKSDPPSTVSEAEESTLSNHLVLKQIFLYLEPKRLLRLSLVNKLWCSTARSVLRSQKRCLAAIRGENPCIELRALNQVLATSSGHPFTGLALRTHKLPKETDLVLPTYNAITHPCMCTTNQSHDESTRKGVSLLLYKALLEKLTFRHLEIFWPEVLPDDCPAQELLQKILKERREEIVELKIVSLPPSIYSLKEHLHLETRDWLPNLKVLDFYDCDKVYLRGRDRNLKYHLLQAAPQLKKQLGLSDHWDLDYFFHSKKSSVLKHFAIARRDFFHTGRENYREKILKFGSLQPKLTKLVFTGSHLEHDPEHAGNKTMIEFLRQVLESSQSSLEEMQLDQAMFIDSLPNAVSQPLLTLKELWVGVNPSIDRWMGLPTLERFDWGGIFPFLKTVIFIGRGNPSAYDFPIADIEGLDVEPLIRDAILQRRVGSACEAVEKIVLDKIPDVGALGYFRRLFPNVKKFVHELRVQHTLLEEVFEFLWTTWPKLESITISNAPEYAVSQNLDAVFCGISEEQADAYRMESEESLSKKEVQLGAPSILSFQCLRKLRVEVLHSLGKGRCRENIQRDSSQFLLTHVTGILAFPRMPGFEMEVVRDRCGGSGPCGYQLEHLRPFVKLIDKVDA